MGGHRGYPHGTGFNGVDAALHNALLAIGFTAILSQLQKGSSRRVQTGSRHFRISTPGRLRQVGVTPNFGNAGGVIAVTSLVLRRR
jgi:hypothetical protein